MIGASEDDMKLLLAKSFILLFDTGIIVIKHWRINNYIQNDRYKPTMYTDERSMLTLKDNNEYLLEGECIQNGYITDTQYRLGKDSKGKDSKEKSGRFTPPSLEDVTAYINEKGIVLDPEAFIDFYTSKGWKVGSSTMKDWQAAARNWARRDKQNEPKQKPEQKPSTGGMSKDNKFMDYDQREYDYDALEKMLTAN
jgi:hypothetical protein